MNLTEAIKHCEDVADYDCFTDEQRKCSDEHRQLADWLKDYKRLLAKESGVDFRCGNCKYDATQEMCGKCYEYSRWESDTDE